MSALLLAKVSTPNEQRCACRFVEPYHARAKALTEAELGTHRTAPANGPPLTPARPLPRSLKLYSNFKLLTCLDVITSGTGNPVRPLVRMQSRTTLVGKRIPLKLSKPNHEVSNVTVHPISTGYLVNATTPPYFVIAHPSLTLTKRIGATTLFVIPICFISISRSQR